ncbi:MAG: cyclic nucleotide-binding domain-containing protein [Caldilineaceae bacterium]|nr:cyclic nucleotide-binding domain-containing protein [Caldilineaceae bacterium]
MLSITEKINILHGVELFATTPLTTLTDLAALVEEVAFAADATIFALGDYGDAMYILLAGRVRVHSGGRTLTIMEPQQVFGEMAVLDPEPRSASVTTIEATSVLRIERAALYRLLATRTEVATGIIQILCRRLRDRTTSMVEDYHYLQQVERLTAAAGAVEAGHYDPAQVEEVTQRTDALGNLARVFQQMIREIYAREQRLQQQVQELRIEVDQVRQSQQVNQITGSDYFQQLRGKATQLRKQLRSREEE